MFFGDITNKLSKIFVDVKSFGRILKSKLFEALDIDEVKVNLPKKEENLINRGIRVFSWNYDYVIDGYYLSLDDYIRKELNIGYYDTLTDTTSFFYNFIPSINRYKTIKSIARIVGKIHNLKRASGYTDIIKAVVNSSSWTRRKVTILNSISIREPWLSGEIKRWRKIEVNGEIKMVPVES